MIFFIKELKTTGHMEVKIYTNMPPNIC